MNRYSLALAALVTLLSAGCGNESVDKPIAAAVNEKAPELKILRWGPNSTPSGEVFNKQPNGSSAVWFEMSGAVQAASMEAWFGNSKLDNLSIASDKGGAVQIPNNLISAAGRYPIVLIHAPSKTKYELGLFEVLPRPADPPSISIKNWGPQATTTQATFNRQPTGNSAIWFEMIGTVHQSTMEAHLGDKKLPLVIASDKGGAIEVPAAAIATKGRYPLYILHAPTGTRFDLGVFEVK